MEPKPEQAERVATTSPFWVVVMIGLAFASGYMAARSVVFNPAGFMTVAQIQLGGTLISVVLVVLAFSIQGKLVKITKKPNR